jgi:hypothetical protein
VLLKRELRPQSNNLAAVKLTYSMYGRDDPLADPERLFTLSEASRLSGASTICTQNSLGGNRATSVQMGTTRSIDEIGDLKAMGGAVYGSTDPAPTGQTNPTSPVKNPQLENNGGHFVSLGSAIRSVVIVLHRLNVRYHRARSEQANAQAKGPTHTLLFTFVCRVPCNVKRWFYNCHVSQQPSITEFIDDRVRHLVFNPHSLLLTSFYLRRGVTDSHWMTTIDNRKIDIRILDDSILA